MLSWGNSRLQKARASQNGPMASTLLLHANMLSSPLSLMEMTSPADSGGVIVGEGVGVLSLEQANIRGTRKKAAVSILHMTGIILPSRPSLILSNLLVD